MIDKILLATAIILAGANFYLRGAQKQNGAPAGAKVVTVTTVSNVTSGPEAISTNLPPEIASPKWAPLESEEYTVYMANLRRFGFPEELIRNLIVAEIDAFYAPRIDPLKPKPVPHDAPLEMRRRQPTPDDIVRMRAWQKLEMEKQKQMEAVLGVHVPREMIRTPISRNFEASEYAISLLPPEKQEAVRIIFENTWIKDDENQSVPSSVLAERTGFKSEMDAYRAAVAEAHEQLQKIVTPEEFERLKLYTTPPGTEMLRNIIGMDATEEEQLKMFRIISEQWEKQGAVYGRWRATPQPPEVIAAADQEAAAALAAALGPERYTDYQMATWTVGQQMNNLGNRYGLPDEAVREAFGYQREIDRIKRETPSAARTPAILEQIDSLQSKLDGRLGPTAAEAWAKGRNLKYEINP
jgi:hypothetical protein